MALLGSLHGMALTDSVERGSGSPFPSRQLKSLALAEQHPIAGRDPACQVASSPSTKHSDNGSNASPVNAERYEQIRQSPDWRPSPKFVSGCSRNGAEDPFVVSHNRAVLTEAMSESLAYLRNCQTNRFVRCRRRLPTSRR